MLNRETMDRLGRIAADLEMRLDCLRYEAPGGDDYKDLLSELWDVEAILDHPNGELPESVRDLLAA